MKLQKLVDYYEFCFSRNEKLPLEINFKSISLNFDFLQNGDKIKTE